MSIGRLPPTLQTTIPPTRPVDAARGAFFAAVKSVGAAAESPKASTPAAAPMKAQATVQPEPTRMLRPGSLVDIKV
jgi:hypothetical protein